MALSEEQLARRVGAVALLVLGLAALLVLTLDGAHLRPGLTVHVELARTGALVEGAPVRLAGREIGRIDRIRFVSRAGAVPYAEDPAAERATVVLDVWIDGRWARHVRQNSAFFQNQPTILAGAYLEIGPPDDGAEPGPPVTHGFTLRGAEPPRMDEIARRSYENLGNALDMIRVGFPEARALGHELDELSRQLDALAGPDVDVLLEGRRKLWAEGLAAWQAWQESGVDTDDLRRVDASARATIARARRELAALRVKIDALADALAALGPRLDPARFRAFEVALARVDGITVQAENVLRQAEQIAAMFERGEGTLAAFFQDTEIADEFKAMSKVLKTMPWEVVGHPMPKKPSAP